MSKDMQKAVDNLEAELIVSTTLQLANYAINQWLEIHSYTQRFEFDITPYEMLLKVQGVMRDAESWQNHLAQLEEKKGT